ncbi:MAG: flagellar export chaperone FliS [Lachnospirales bacterium]
MKNPYAAYANNAINTASKFELTLMLYEGAIKFCNQAEVAIKNKNYEESNRLLQRIQDIVRELQVTLKTDTEVAKNMYSLYQYIYELLMEANIKKDINKLMEATDLIREFRDMWKEGMDKIKSGK